MTPSPKALKGSEQCQDDCTSENFVRNRAVSNIVPKQWGTKRDLYRFYVNTVLQDQTGLDLFFKLDFIVFSIRFDSHNWKLIPVRIWGVLHWPGCLQNIPTHKTA